MICSKSINKSIQRSTPHVCEAEPGPTIPIRLPMRTQAAAKRTRRSSGWTAPGHSGLVEAKVDPLLSSLKKDPRYAALLTKMRLPL